MPTELTPLVTTTGAGAPSGKRLIALDLLRVRTPAYYGILDSKGLLSNMQYPHEQWYDMPEYNGNVYHFMTRFVTSFCAPGFFFLMGWGVALFVESRRNAGWPWMRIFKHYALRGLVLILAQELTDLAVWNIPQRIMNHKYVTTVLFALGINIFLGALILNVEYSAVSHPTVARLTKRQTTVLTALAYAVIAGVLTVLPSLYVPKPEAADTVEFSTWYLLLFLPKASEGDWRNPDFRGVLAIYPVVPWLAHTVWGIGIGRISARLKLGAPRLALLNMVLGIAMLFTAIPLRYNADWTSINPELLPDIRTSFIGFFNNVKYPPSIVYTLITLAGNHILLGVFFAVKQKDNAAGILRVFGSSALFFYMTHFWTYQLFAYVLAACGAVDGSSKLTDGAYWFCYLLGLAVEYFLCRSYGAFKSSTSKDSLWRLF
ncbi:hypothetical protein HDU82_005479 [Entophlyctis luteolus]|nr:hypothetical protein HDU82_005479 [Entophlyctis luteolus]